MFKCKPEMWSFLSYIPYNKPGGQQHSNITKVFYSVLGLYHRIQLSSVLYFHCRHYEILHKPGGTVQISIMSLINVCYAG